MDVSLPFSLLPAARRSPALKAYLTHYLVAVLGDQQLAVGEAGGVRNTGRKSWYAQVSEWGWNRWVTPHRLDPRSGKCPEWRKVEGPFFKLVRKNRYRGKLPP